jgi:hypothetical protein
MAPGVALEVTVPVAPELPIVGVPVPIVPAPTATVFVAPATVVVIEAVVTITSVFAAEVNAVVNLPAAVDEAPPNGASTEVAVTESDPVVGVIIALDGATESIPKPNAATATSEIRLKVVFVDICFLSISRSREFP